MIPTRITRFINPIRNRNDAETIVPKTPPNCSSPELECETASKDGAFGEHQAQPDRHDDRRVTQGEPVAERQRATRALSTPWRSLRSLRVVLSIAEMWSASKAWRSPKV